jgi:hypothetical protein
VLYDIAFTLLGSQLARLIFGNEAGKGATVAVNKLVGAARQGSAA